MTIKCSEVEKERILTIIDNSDFCFFGCGCKTPDNDGADCRECVEKRVHWETEEEEQSTPVKKVTEYQRLQMLAKVPVARKLVHRELLELAGYIERMQDKTQGNGYVRGIKECLNEVKAYARYWE